MHRVLILATVTDVYDKTISYPSCVLCYSKLLIDPTTSRYHCLRCGSSLSAEEITWRYRLALSVCDGVTICRVVVFGRTLDTMFGKDATDFNRSLLHLEKSGYSGDKMLSGALRRTFKGKYFYFGFKTSTLYTIDQTPSLEDIVTETRTRPCDQMDETSEFENPPCIAYQIIASSDGVYATVTDHMRLLVKQLRSGNNIVSEQTDKLPEVNKHDSLREQSEFSNSCHTMSFGSGQKSVKFSFEGSLAGDCSRENYLSESNTTCEKLSSLRLSLVTNEQTQDDDKSCNSNIQYEAVTIDHTNGRLEESYIEELTGRYNMEFTATLDTQGNQNDGMERFRHISVPTLSQLPITQRLDFSSDGESDLSCTSRKIDRELKKRERLRSSLRLWSQSSFPNHTSPNVSTATSTSCVPIFTNSVVNNSNTCYTENLKCSRSTSSRRDESYCALQENVTRRKPRSIKTSHIQDREKSEHRTGSGRFCANENTTLFVENFDNMPESEPLEAFLDSFSDFTIDSEGHRVAVHEDSCDDNEQTPTTGANKLQTTLNDTNSNSCGIAVRISEYEQIDTDDNYEIPATERVEAIPEDSCTADYKTNLTHCELESTDKSRVLEDFPDFEDPFSQSYDILQNKPICEIEENSEDESYCLLNTKDMVTHNVDILNNRLTPDTSVKRNKGFSPSDRNASQTTERKAVNNLIEMPESENLEEFLDSFEAWSLCIEDESDNNTKVNSHTITDTRQTHLINELTRQSSACQENEILNSSEIRDISKQITHGILPEDEITQETSDKQDILKSSECRSTENSGKDKETVDLKSEDPDYSSDLEELEDFLDKVSLEQVEGRQNVADSGCNEPSSDSVGTTQIWELLPRSDHNSYDSKVSESKKDKTLNQTEKLENTSSVCSEKNVSLQEDGLDEHCSSQHSSNLNTDSKIGLVHNVEILNANGCRVSHQSDSVYDTLVTSELDTDLEQFMNDFSTTDEQEEISSKAAAEVNAPNPEITEYLEQEIGDFVAEVHTSHTECTEISRSSKDTTDNEHDSQCSRSKMNDQTQEGSMASVEQTQNKDGDIEESVLTDDNVTSARIDGCVPVTDSESVDEIMNSLNDESLDILEQTVNYPVFNPKNRKHSLKYIPFGRQVFQLRQKRVSLDMVKQIKPLVQSQDAFEGFNMNLGSPCSDTSLFAESPVNVYAGKHMSVHCDTTPIMNTVSLQRKRLPNTSVDMTSSLNHTSKVSTPVLNNSCQNDHKGLDEYVIFDSQELSPLLKHDVSIDNNSCYGDSVRKVTFDPRLQRVCSVRIMDIKMKVCSPLKQKLFVPKSCLKRGSTENTPTSVKKPCSSVAEEISENNPFKPNACCNYSNGNSMEVFGSQDLFEASVNLSGTNQVFIVEGTDSTSSNSVTCNKSPVTIMKNSYCDNSSNDLFDDSFEDLVQNNVNTDLDESDLKQNHRKHITHVDSNQAVKPAVHSHQALQEGNRKHGNALKPLIMNSPDILQTVLKYQCERRKVRAGGLAGCVDKENQCPDESLDLFDNG